MSPAVLRPDSSETFGTGSEAFGTGSATSQRLMAREPSAPQKPFWPPDWSGVAPGAEVAGASAALERTAALEVEEGGAAALSRALGRQDLLLHVLSRRQNLPVPRKREIIDCSYEGMEPPSQKRVLRIGFENKRAGSFKRPALARRVLGTYRHCLIGGNKQHGTEANVSAT